VNTSSHTYETHRYISGYARRALGNFYYNDWDRGSGVFRSLSSSEIAYLKSIYLNAGTTWYIDLTGRRVSSSGFQNSVTSSTKKSQTDSGYRYIGNNTYERVITVYTHTSYKHVTYQNLGYLYDSSPLVLDINKDTVIDTAKNEWMPHAPKFYKEYALYFDITGDGVKDYTEWIEKGSRDAILVMPENGKVENALQLFGIAGGYKDGFEKLSIVCDKDNNGWIEGEELQGLYLWFDENRNATCEPSELKPLSDYNIQKLSTKNESFVGSYVTADGQEHTMWDWWPAVMEMRAVRQ